MALDPSIILRDISPKLEDPQNVLAKQLQMKAAQQQYDDNAFKLQQDRETSQQQNALAQLFGRQGFNAQTPEGQAELHRVGGVANAQKYLKGAADIGKTKADTEKITFELADKKFAVARNMLNTVQTPEQAQMWLKGAFTDPHVGPLIQQFSTYEDAVARIGNDPQSFAQCKAQASLTADKLQDKLHQDIVAAETGRHNKASEGIQIRGQDRQSFDNAASRQVQMRGQNMVDSRSRESNAASMSKPFEVTDESGNKVLVQQDKQGNIKRVEGFSPKSGADKPLTDAQSKAALFGTRMQNSDQIINDLAGKGTTTSVPFSRAGFGVGSTINAASSGSQQQLDQAKRDFINATLRRESGAVISPSEFDNAEKQYFPQIGDSAAVIKQKANNRAIATRGVQAEVPKGQRGVINEIAGSNTPSIDSLLQKYAK